MDEYPRVSVCIPTFNHDDSVGRAIRSVLEQDYPNFELLVVDDCSSDRTLEVASAFDDARIRVLRNPRNLGLVGNHNRCLELSQGSLVQFVHGDDRLLPGALAALVKRFQQHRVGLVFAPREIESPDSAWVRQFGNLHSRYGDDLQPVNDGNALVHQYVSRGKAKGNWIGEPTAVMIRADLARSVGGFDPRLTQMLDMELWTRLAAGHLVGWVPNALSVRSHGAQTASVRNSTAAVAYVDRLLVLQSLIRNRELPRRTRALASQQLVVATLRTLFDAVRADELGTSLRSRLRQVDWRDTPRQIESSAGQ